MSERKNTEIFNALMQILGFEEDTLQQMLGETCTSEQFHKFMQSNAHVLCYMPASAGDSLSKTSGMSQMRFAILLWSAFSNLVEMVWTISPPKFSPSLRISDAMKRLGSELDKFVQLEPAVLWEEGVLIECNVATLTDNTLNCNNVTLWHYVMQFCIGLCLTREYMICTNSENAHLLDGLHGAACGLLASCGVYVAVSKDGDFIGYLRAMTLIARQTITADRMYTSFVSHQYTAHADRMEFYGAGFSAGAEATDATMH